jgi:hypothetical protein
MMKQEALFKRLGSILGELNDQYEFLSQNPEQLSEVELELFLANANFLTDHIQIVRKLNLPLRIDTNENNFEPLKNDIIIENDMNDEFKDEQQVEAITFAQNNMPDIEELVEAKLALDSKEEEKELFKLDIQPERPFEFILNTDSFSEDDKFDFEERSAEQLFDRPLSEEEAHILAQKLKVKEKIAKDPVELEDDEIGPEPFLVHKEEVIIPEPIKASAEVIAKEEIILDPKPTEKVPADTEKAPTLNDLLAGKNSATRVNEASGAVVTDLRSAISLNDKLLYIKDLFGGYNLAYAEAIDLANKMPNFDAADNFFQKNYAVKNNWADKQTTVDKFYLLLNRRFRD